MFGVPNASRTGDVVIGNPVEKWEKKGKFGRSNPIRSCLARGPSSLHAKEQSLNFKNRSFFLISLAFCAP